MAFRYSSGSAIRRPIANNRPCWGAKPSWQDDCKRNKKS